MAKTKIAKTLSDRMNVSVRPDLNETLITRVKILMSALLLRVAKTKIVRIPTGPIRARVKSDSREIKDGYLYKNLLFINGGSLNFEVLSYHRIAVGDQNTH